MKYQNKIILAGLMGNLVEAYDVSICYFLLNELSTNFLGDNKSGSWIVLTLFFIAYLAKPIGAFILGLCSDLFGRKRAMMASIAIMGISTALTGLIPGYSHIGLFAASIFIALRIIQSMALGSEFLNSASFLVESGDDKQRGFRGCWSSVGVKAGTLLACLVAAAIHQMIRYFPEHNWLWRVPFLLAILTTGVGYAIRYSMPESLGFIIYYANRKKPTIREIYQKSVTFIKQYPFLFNYVFFASFLSVATGFFFYLYIPLHAATHSHLPHSFITISTILSLTTVTTLIPIFGWVSDKCDRLKMLTFASSGLLVLAYPFMHAINSGNYVYFLTMQVVISIPCACYYSVSSVVLAELFPLPIRCTALSIIYSIAASLASGGPPLLADFLVRNTQIPDSPCLIMMLFSTIVLINVNALAKKYRSGRNKYSCTQQLTDNYVFEIHYGVNQEHRLNK